MLVEPVKKVSVSTEWVPAPAKKGTKYPEPVNVAEDFVGTISLGGGGTGNPTIGKNKCGMAWKKGSTRSKFSKGPSISYLRSIEEK